MTGFVQGRNLGEQQVSLKKHLNTQSRQYTFCTFAVPPAVHLNDGYSAPGGSDTNVNWWHQPADIGGTLFIEQSLRGAATIKAPVFAAGGLQVSGDLTDTEGAAHVFGASSNIARGKHIYTIGTSKRFFARLKVKIADVSGITEALFGFRKQQAHVAAHASYTDYAAMGLITTDGNVTIKGRINSGTAFTVDTTHDWADTETHTLYQEIGVDGYSRFLYDGVFPSVSKHNHVFDSGDVVVPFFDFLHATTSPGLITFVEFESGFVPERGV